MLETENCRWVAERRLLSGVTHRTGEMLGTEGVQMCLTVGFTGLARWPSGQGSWPPNESAAEGENLLLFLTCCGGCTHTAKKKIRT